MAKLKLRQKGIALVCLPLGFQIMFLVILIGLLSNADSAIKREAASKQVIYISSDMLRHSIDCGTSIAIYNFTRDSSFREKCMSAMDQLNRDHKEIAKLVMHNPDQRRRLAKCTETHKEMVSVFDRLLYKIDNNTESLKVFEDNAGLMAERQLLSRHTQRTRELVDAERVLCKTFVEQEKKARQHVVNALIGGVILNLLVAYFAARYFFRNISNRLEKLTNSTALLAERKTNDTTDSAGDEITDLDQAFHQAVDEIKDLEDMRRELLGMVTHDLRSPLTSVDAALTLINEGALGQVSEEVHRVSKNASEDIGRLLKLTNDLLDADRLVSKGITLRKTSTSARDLLSSAVHVMEFQSLNSDIPIETVVAKDFTLYADPDRLNQVLCNLIGNAIKFSSKGNKVVVEAVEGSENHEFRVIDTGSGIAIGDQQRIFDRFSKLSDESVPGKGLGLAICKALVELHGGEIGVESTPEEGAVFWFTVPANDSP